MNDGGAISAEARILDAATVHQISPLHLRARTVAEGMLVGTHKSHRFGSSSEFAEHKVYTPGDDTRHLDWRAYARMDRFYVRRYEEETNLDIFLVVDASKSMAYAGGAKGALSASKLDVARTYAAALAYLAHRQSDAAGLSVFWGDKRPPSHLPPRARRDRLLALYDALLATTAEGKTAAIAALEQVSARMQRRALVVVISDLLDVGMDILGPLGVLRERGADVLLLQTLHDDELDFPFDGVVRFEDLEGDREAQVDAPGVRAAYLEELRRWLKDLEQGASRRDLRYVLTRTSDPPASVLARALAQVGRGTVLSSAKR